MDEIDFGEFGMLSPEKALEQMKSLKKDYASLQSEFTKRSQALKEHEEYAQVVNLINDLGIGDQVASMIMQAQQGGYPSQYGPEAYKQTPDNIPNDPYVMDALSKIDELEERLQGYEQMYWGDKAQQDITQFKNTHSDLSEEDVNQVGQFMMDNRFPTLDAAYKYMRFDDMMEAARLDGEKRVQEQMRAGRSEEGEGVPVLGGGEGGLQSEEGKPPPGDWNAATQAALNDFLTKEGDETE